MGRTVSRKTVSALAGIAALHAGLAAAQPPEALSAGLSVQLQALQRQRLQRTAAEQKISSQLLQMIRAADGEPPADGVPSMRPVPPEGPTELVTIYGRITPELQAFLAAQGAAEIVALPQYAVLSVRLPIGAIRTVAGRPEVSSIELHGRAVVARTPGLQNPEGDAAHGAASARAAYGATGRGVTVCVISDSVDHLTEAQANMSLASVDVLTGKSNIHANPGTPGTPGYLEGHTGEGTAMLELIHRIAPHASLKFATSYDDAGGASEAAMASNILALKGDGCQIMADDVSYTDESPFQGGPVSRAVAEASDAGILYFSSAANDGNIETHFSGTWEGDFSPGQFDAVDQITPHEFKPGQSLNKVTFVSSETAKLGQQRAYLWWNDALGGAFNDYILIDRNAAGDIVGLGDTTINGTANPVQVVNVSDGDYLEVLQRAGAQPRFLHLQLTDGAKLGYATTGAIFGHNGSDAANAFSIGAVSARGRTTPFSGGSALTVEPWSSDGPRRVFFSPYGGSLAYGNFTGTGGLLLHKPEFVAADCVTADITGDPVSFAPFCGTSAAVSQAAAIAALVMSDRPHLSLGQIRQVMVSASLPISSTPGWDSASGAGIIMAPSALAEAERVFIDFNVPPHTRFPSPLVLDGRNIQIDFNNSSFSCDGDFAKACFLTTDTWRPAPQITMYYYATSATPLTISITHATGKVSNTVAGRAPISIFWGDTNPPLVSQYDVALAHGGSPDYFTDTFTVPASEVKVGSNRLLIYYNGFPQALNRGPPVNGASAYYIRYLSISQPSP